MKTAIQISHLTNDFYFDKINIRLEKENNIMKTSKSVKVYLQMGYPIALAHHKAKNQVKHFHKSQKKEEKEYEK